MGDSLGECISKALAVLANRGWSLGDQNSIAKAACAEFVNASAQKQKLEWAVVRHYSPVLHAACGDVGTSQQERAYKELWAHLYKQAKRKVDDADLAEDMAQEALTRTWKNLRKCREPKCFLGYATLILINAIRDYYREPETVEPQQSELIEEDDFPPTDTSEIEPLSDDLAEFDDKARAELIAAIEECVNNDTCRSVLLEWLKETGFKRISEMLAITVNHVYQCKLRAIRELRRCVAFWRFLDRRVF